MKQSALIVFTLLLCACDSAPAGPKQTHVGNGPELDVGDPPPPARQSKRMTVQQLRASVPVALGETTTGMPVTWRVQNFDVLSPAVLGPTLGNPDYINITHEAAEATTLFVKLTADMARNVCAQSVSLQRFEDVGENLRYLHLRFFGERVADDDAVAGLRRVYDAAGGEQAGWHAVCVALVESPAFYIY